jgi:hypothetical protein
MRMYVIAIVAVALIAGLLYLLDRALKAVQTGRRRRDIATRMAPALAYAEEQAKQKEQTKTARSALTSVLPSIQRPEKGPRRVA